MYYWVVADIAKAPVGNTRTRKKGRRSAKPVPLVPLPPQTSCYDEEAKAQYRSESDAFFRAFARELKIHIPSAKVRVKWNPGGIAVWGNSGAEVSIDGEAVVEAFISESLGLCVRQLRINDGRRQAGRNNWAKSLNQGVELAVKLAGEEFSGW